MIQEQMHASATVWVWERLIDADAGDKTSVETLMYDAFRFVLRYRDSIRQDPTQVYFLAMFFAPKASLTRLNCQKLVSTFPQMVPAPPDNWSPYLYPIRQRWGSLRLAFGFSEDGQTMFQATNAGIAKWNAVDGSSSVFIEWHETVLCLSHNGNVLASRGPTTNTLNVWEVQTERLLSTINKNEISTMSSLTRMAPDGKAIAIQVTEAGAIRQGYFYRDEYRCRSPCFIELYETRTGNLIQQVKCAKEDCLGSLNFSADGHMLAIKNRSFSSVLLWDV
ncbi:hypothetical protein H9Q74_001035 [Fusarium xylarioides]|nr:hypothetical protein H9Q71_000829 [Fusarium xylarioides]KAG5828893.1 hypothetical protein H9Q74_001035 [Fusarium xylarioides]